MPFIFSPLDLDAKDKSDEHEDQSFTENIERLNRVSIPELNSTRQVEEKARDGNDNGPLQKNQRVPRTSGG
jgi:hypothetical protein